MCDHQTTEVEISNNTNTSAAVAATDDLKWLNHQYLSKIISYHIGQQVQVKTYGISPATSKGENFASSMNLAVVEYVIKNPTTLMDNPNCNLHKISFILKSRLENEFFDEIEQEFNVFERESQVYKIILHRCESLLAKIGDDIQFGPRALYVDERVIVQENLKEKGYRIMNVKDRLDYDHCQWVIKLLAKFHAATLILGKKEPDLFKFHMMGNVTEKLTPMHVFYKNLIQTCIQYAKTALTLQKYVTKLENFGENIIERMIKVFSRSNGENEIRLLNHGDMWVNNLMFKKDLANNTVGLLMVDYQEGYFGSPGIDLNYFIYTSMSKEVYIKHKNDLIKIYHKILIDTLKLLNYDGNLPKLEDIFNEIRRKADHGICAALCILPVLINEHSELSDITNFLSDTEEAEKNRLIVIDNPHYIERLEQFLQDFEENGLL